MEKEKKNRLAETMVLLRDKLQNDRKYRRKSTLPRKETFRSTEEPGRSKTQNAELKSI